MTTSSAPTRARMTSRAWSAVAVTAALISLAGALVASGVLDRPPLDCGKALSDHMGHPARHAIIAFDRSDSTRSADSPDPAYLPTAEDLVQREIDQGGVITIGGFDGSTGTTSLGADHNTAVTDDNPSRRTTHQQQIEECVDKDLVQAYQAPPASPGTDIIGALSQAAAKLSEGAETTTPATAPSTGTPAGDDPSTMDSIALFTDGLATTGCADLRSVAIGNADVIPGITTACASSLPHLSHVAVTLYGIGRPASTPNGQQPTSLDVGWLQTLWSSLCQATGATCKVVSTGLADQRTASPGTAAPRPVPPTSINTDPAIAFPPDDERSIGNSTTYQLPQASLFDKDSASIVPAALPELQKIAGDAKSHPGTTTRVDGYTDDENGDANAIPLSQQRATAVADELNQLGVTNITTIAHGNQDPLCMPQYLNGTPQPAAMACDRRVQVVLTYPGA